MPPLLRGNPLFRDAHRSATEGMVKESESDPRAERKRRQKERKAERRQLRHAIRTDGIAMAARLFLDARAQGYRETAPEDDCPACLALQQRAA